MVGSNKQMPILCKINLLKDELMGGGGIIDPMYNKMLWLPTNHRPLKEIQLYISDRHGRFAPLVDCNIDCTLVFIPHTNNGFDRKVKGTFQAYGSKRSYA